ncbi:MAG: DUF222 domain-containing protein [Terrimesophilobacter sp.]
MNSFAVLFSISLESAMVAATGIPDSVAAVRGLDDRTLVATQRRLSDLRRLVDARASLVAGEVAFRSRRELGYTGLAQKEGFHSAEKLIQSTTGSTRREASTLVTAGTLVHESMTLAATDPVTGEVPEGFDVHEPWLAPVGAAVAGGRLTVEAARAIRSGLGEPTDSEGSLPPEALTEAVRTLLETAIGDDENRGLDADALYRLARQLRDDLDEAGIAERELLIYGKRSFRRMRQPGGQSRFILDPDLEMSAWLDDVYDKLTSPRRGGPRFIDDADRVWAENIATDPRTTEQYLHDAIFGLLRFGVDADLAGADGTGAVLTGAVHSGAVHTCAEGTDDGPAGTIPTESERPGTRRRAPRIVGSRVPAVRVLVTEESLLSRTGHGRLEGSGAPVSMQTVERFICTSGTLPVIIGREGNVLDLGRETRLFTNRQKIALSVRDGGCLWSGCDSPASWTEAHHINHWSRDHGNTDLADGVLLCRHHHLLLHNNHWEIQRKGNAYWLIPPPDIDPARKPRQLTSKSAALRDLQRERLGARLEGVTAPA